MNWVAVVVEVVVEVVVDVRESAREGSGYMDRARWVPKTRSGGTFCPRVRLSFSILRTACRWSSSSSSSVSEEEEEEATRSSAVYLSGLRVSTGLVATASSM